MADVSNPEHPTSKMTRAAVDAERFQLLLSGACALIVISSCCHYSWLLSAMLAPILHKRAGVQKVCCSWLDEQRTVLPLLSLHLMPFTFSISSLCRAQASRGHHGKTRLLMVHALPGSQHRHYARDHTRSHHYTLHLAQGAPPFHTHRHKQDSWRRNRPVLAFFWSFVYACATHLS